MKTKTVNILGREYTIEHRKESEDSNLKDCDGYCDNTIALLVIDDMSEHKDDENVVRDLTGYRKQVTRHEIVHAFLFESGLCASSMEVKNWATCEEIIDWIAIQSPKIFKACQEADCL